MTIWDWQFDTKLSCKLWQYKREREREREKWLEITLLIFLDKD